MNTRDHIAAIAYAFRFVFLYAVLPLLVLCAALVLVTR